MTVTATPRRSGRAEKRHIRAHTLAHDPNIVAPSMEGGAYTPLSTTDIERINETALRILETYGLANAAPNAFETLKLGGARMTWRRRSAGRGALWLRDGSAGRPNRRRGGPQDRRLVACGARPGAS
jgi:hypothetical protein